MSITKSGLRSYASLGQFKTIKTLTLSNSTGALDLFTVTGHVDLVIVAVCTTNLASAAAGNIEVGIAGATDAILPTTIATDLDAEEIWHDNAPDSDIETADEARRNYAIVNDADVIMTLSAQIDSGVIALYCYWTPHSTDGNVIAA